MSRLKLFAIPLVAALLVGVFSATSAHAVQRLALVIGNGGYQSVSSLKNPTSDAELMARTLADVGFEVTLLTDADQVTLTRGVAEFGRALRSAGPDATGLFYFAGHGVQSFGRNYLLPVDTDLSDPADLDFVALEAQTVLRQMFSARNRTNIVILDACRNNPFDAIPEFGDSGLAEMKAPTGTFLAYATAPNDVAFDGTGTNSPFSAALARELSVPGRTIEDVFREVRIDVLETTRGAQTPWDTSSLTVEFMFVEGEPTDPAAVAAEQLWAGVKATNDPLQVMLYLRGYPDSPFAHEARGLLTSLLANELDSPSAAPEVPQTEVASREQNLIDAAQSSGSAAAYEAYLSEFPNGVFAEFARSELATKQAKDPIADGTDFAAAAPATPTPAAPSSETDQNASKDVLFDTPILSGSTAVNGRTIAQLANGEPLYAPIEGIPEELWKGQSCSNCHEWTRERLCTQANVYLNVTATAQRSLQKEHPYGGAFKQALRDWAHGGCS
ncbi:caspase family protein [Tropicimonas sp. S265A]|uniref:caspase family protein n=1 Tax=Tropicimonas sp. S265A TaxID=3415134 RepID=UPI003C7B92D0